MLLSISFPSHTKHTHIYIYNHWKNCIQRDSRGLKIHLINNPSLAMSENTLISEQHSKKGIWRQWKTTYLLCSEIFQTSQSMVYWIKVPECYFMSSAVQCVCAFFLSYRFKSSPWSIEIKRVLFKVFHLCVRVYVWVPVRPFTVLIILHILVFTP